MLAPHLAGGWCARSARKARVRSGSWQGQTFGTDRTSAHPSNAAVRVAALHGPHRGWNVIMKQLAQIALFQRRRGSTTPRHLSAWSDPPAGPSRVPGARRHQQGRDAHGRLGSQPCSRSSAVEWHTKNVFRGKFHWHCGAPRIGLATRSRVPCGVGTLPRAGLPRRAWPRRRVGCLQDLCWWMACRPLRWG